MQWKLPRSGALLSCSCALIEHGSDNYDDRSDDYDKDDDDDDDRVKSNADIDTGVNQAEGREELFTVGDLSRSE